MKKPEKNSKENIMNSTQAEKNEVKKKKSHRKLNESPDFICGACLKAYKSYQALYLHIRRKHNSLRPPGTKIKKQSREPLSEDSKMGRPQKVSFSALYRDFYSKIV